MNVYPENRSAKLKIVFEKARKNGGIWDLGCGMWDV
jgi:hypothetical protein